LSETKGKKTRTVGWSSLIPERVPLLKHWRGKRPSNVYSQIKRKKPFFWLNVQKGGREESTLGPSGERFHSSLRQPGKKREEAARAKDAKKIRGQLRGRCLIMGAVPLRHDRRENYEDVPTSHHHGKTFLLLKEVTESGGGTLSPCDADAPSEIQGGKSPGGREKALQFRDTTKVVRKGWPL